MPIILDTPIAVSGTNFPTPVTHVTASIPVPIVTYSSASVATYSQVTAAVSATVLKAANADRKGVTFHNSGTSECYVKLGGAASPTSYTVVVGVGGYYEAPYGWAGELNGYWVSAGGSGSITEITA